jgi:hypothetical protein
MQAAELLQYPEQEEANRAAGDQEVLSVLPETHATQRSQIGEKIEDLIGQVSSSTG